MSTQLTEQEQEQIAEATADEAPAQEAATGAGKRKSAPTSYVILEEFKTPGDSAVPTYKIAAPTTEAQGAEAAVRKAVEGMSEIKEARTFLAIPARSWRGITVSVETKQQLKLT